MIRNSTPVEDRRDEWGIIVKREDLSSPPPGPGFSKARGVWAHLEKRPEKVIGVLDTYHSRAGWAVAEACKALGKECINFYPSRKREPGPFPAQLQAKSLGAELVGLKAGMSAVLWFQARKRIVDEMGGYMMPNALRLPESVEETAREVGRTVLPVWPDVVVIPVSSGTIAAGVIRGFLDRGDCEPLPNFVLHMGYSRPKEVLLKNVLEKVEEPFDGSKVSLIDEGYAYKDEASPGETPDWPCSPYYDLKAFRWTLKNVSHNRSRSVLFWNVG